MSHDFLETLRLWAWLFFLGTVATKLWYWHGYLGTILHNFLHQIKKDYRLRRDDKKGAVSGLTQVFGSGQRGFRQHGIGMYQGGVLAGKAAAYYYPSSWIC